MKRALAVSYVVGLFVLGILVGALGMFLFHAHVGPPGMPHPPHDRPDPMMFFEHMQSRLDLTPEQEVQIRDILHRSRREGRELHEELLPRVRAHMDHTRDEIREVLTPEQREIFDDISRHHRGRAERFFLGRDR